MSLVLALVMLPSRILLCTSNSMVSTVGLIYFAFILLYQLRMTVRQRAFSHRPSSRTEFLFMRVLHSPSPRRGLGGGFKHQTTLHPVWDEYVLYYVYLQGWH